MGAFEALITSLVGINSRSPTTARRLSRRISPNPASNEDGNPFLDLFDVESHFDLCREFVFPPLETRPMNIAPSGHPTSKVLSAYGSGKLDESVADAVRKHVDRCSDCQNQLAGLPVGSFSARGRLAPTGSHAMSERSEVRDTQLDGRVPGTQTSSLDNTLPLGLRDHPDYHVVRELGRGGMGVVYLVQNKLMERKEVLKVIGDQVIARPESLERFQREIRSAARLQHANIVIAYSVLRFGESLAMAMEYVDGYDLSYLVRKNGPLSIAIASNFTYQAALGLQHALEQGMVHRDIKPSNLMVARFGKKPVIKVLDFGLAKVTSEGQVAAAITREGQMLGTPDYVAPEQIRDAQSADVRADIYSLGCTLYCLLSGQPPFRGDHVWDVYQAHFSMDATPLNLVRPDVPTELAALVSKMMAKDPARRFQTPKDVSEALTPFFKKASASHGRSQPELSSIGETLPGRPVTQSRPSGAEIGPGVVPATHPTESSVPRGHRDSLVESSPAPQSPHALTVAALARRRPRAFLMAVAGILVVGLCVARFGWIIRVATPDGVVVLEDLPENAEVFIDDGTITINAPRSKKFAEIKIAAGDHKIEVRLAGHPAFVSKVSVKPRGSHVVAVILAPLKSGRPEERRVENNEASRGLAGALEHAPGTLTESVINESGFVSLFNGRDLGGWKTHPSQAGTWRVSDDGVLMDSGPRLTRLYSTSGDYNDFHMRIEARFNHSGHAAVYVRSPFVPGPENIAETETGYGVLINSTRGDRPRTGSIFREEINKVFGVWGAHPVAPGGWFTMEIVADGELLFTRVNGAPMAYHVTANWGGQTYESGHLALQRNDAQTKLEIRKIEIRRLNLPGQQATNEILRLSGHINRVAQIQFSMDGRFILSGGSGHTIDYTDDGVRMHGGGNDNTVRLWDVGSGQNIVTTESLPWDVAGIALSSKAEFAASASGWNPSGGKAVSVWDLKTGRQTHRFVRDEARGVPRPSAVAISPDDRRIIAAYSDGQIRSWEIESEKEEAAIIFKGAAFKADEFRSFRFTRGCDRVVTGSQSGTVETWDVATGERTTACTGHAGDVRGVAISGDGRVILSGGIDGTVRVWDAEKGNEIGRMRGHGSEINCVDISWDGRLGLSGGVDGAVILWNLFSRSEICRFSGHLLPVGSVAFSPDGKKAASGSADRTIRIWRLPAP
jgi:serine/threonine protein kinase/WD40 repeat protein